MLLLCTNMTFLTGAACCHVLFLPFSPLPSLFSFSSLRILQDYVSLQRALFLNGKADVGRGAT